MASPEISQNLIPSNPQLQDLLDLVKKDIMMSIICHHIGTVQSFDATKQTATATINYKKTYFDRDAQGLYKPVYVNYPILIDCPCVVLGGGSASLTMPISAGDECLILFNDRDIDNWFQSGQIGPVASSRLHSFSDALILVGVRSLGKVIENFDMTRAVLRNGDAMVGVGAALVKIANNQTTLNTLIGQLITEIQNLVIDVGGGPGGGVVSPTSQAALASVATDFGGLLE